LSPNVVIFRKRLLAYSETFIADQGQLLPNYLPVYAGYQRDPSGADLIAQSRQLLLEDYAVLLEVSKFWLRQGFTPNRSWLSALEQTNPALIHAHFLKDGLDAILIGKHLSIVDRVIAVSDFIAGQALRQGCPESKLIKHRIGIDLDRFKQEKNESQQPSLLFIGRLVEKKGCTYLLQAMAKLKGKFPELKLTIVGEGDLRSSLQQQAESLGLDAEFVGRENAQQIRERLAQCWLFVAPSITATSGDAEGLPIVFLEAQALRAPVVSFYGGGVSEAIEDGSTGLLCEEKDVGALAENIATLLENSTLNPVLIPYLYNSHRVSR